MKTPEEYEKLIKAQERVIVFLNAKVRQNGRPVTVNETQVNKLKEKLKEKDQMIKTLNKQVKKWGEPVNERLLHDRNELEVLYENALYTIQIIRERNMMLESLNDYLREGKPIHR